MFTLIFFLLLLMLLFLFLRHYDKVGERQTVLDDALITMVTLVSSDSNSS
jgi:hypothetical protein